MLHFICPVCGAKINETNSGCECSAGHTFDRSKEGYFNLLLSNCKNSKDPGDNKGMVNARHAFLELGFYAPLAQKITDIITSLKPFSQTILDAGTGTGFYIGYISDKRKPYKDLFLGTDISKNAVKIAARNNKNVECTVASVYSLPYPDKSADIITCIFSPYAINEYMRVLKDDGLLIIVSPKENHLIQLRKLLYSQVNPLETEVPTAGFPVLKEEIISYNFTLTSSEDIANLLTMTPYVYRAPVEKVNAVKNSSSLELTADFKITLLTKHAIDQRRNY